MKTLAAPLPESSYTWYKYNASRGAKLTSVNGKQSVMLKAGSLWGVRSASSSKTALRIITKELGPTKVFSYTDKVVNTLISKSTPVKAGKQAVVKKEAPAIKKLAVKKPVVQEKVTPKVPTAPAPNTARLTKAKVTAVADPVKISNLILSFLTKGKLTEDSVDDGRTKIIDKLTYPVQDYLDNNSPYTLTWAPTIAAMTKTMSCFKVSVVGSLYRGVALSKEPSTAIKSKALSSWTPDPKIAERFGTMWEEFDDKYAAYLLITTPPATSIMYADAMWPAFKKVKRQVITTLRENFQKRGVSKSDAISWVEYLVDHFEEAVTPAEPEVTLAPGTYKITHLKL